ncbi:MAG: hypothetical protein IPM77_06235 [Crocinitomicaceae bacterium]|nr:hypothetical protein [Crocinitomicaceae bacterium]
MFRLLVFAILISFSVCGKSQFKPGISLQTGFNRIGLYYDASVLFDFGKHQAKFGLKYYGPDYVFENHTPGLSLGYKFVFGESNWKFGQGISASFFHENKSTVSLTLSDIQLQFTTIRSMGKKMEIFSVLGLGAVINQFTNITGSNDGTTGYINYEFALGVNYMFGNSDHP